MSDHANRAGPTEAGGPVRGGFSGILNLDKPAGWTSHDVVARVRRTLGQRSAGHAGTLDPMATGVLLVCVGQATRVVEYLTAGQKVYRAVARLGITTDTYDRTGEITGSWPVPTLSETDLSRALDAFVGDIQQVPPAYSAIKQGGVASYRRARRGEAVELAARPVTIERIDILAWRSPELTIEVTCSPGTYIRSLVSDLGRTLGCGAHLADLVRLRSGNFEITDAISLDQLAEAAAAGRAGDLLQPIERALERLLPVSVNEAGAAMLMNGRPILAEDLPDLTTAYARSAGGRVVAILTYRDGQWWPHKVFAANPETARAAFSASAPADGDA